jgi:hypothetical protein
MCIHQSTDLFLWHVKNLREYVKVPYALVAHVPSHWNCAELMLPPNVHAIHNAPTERFTSLLLKGYTSCITHALKIYPECPSIAFLSSGSALVSSIDSLPTVAIGTYSSVLDPKDADLAFPCEHLGTIAHRLKKNMGISTWWQSIDNDPHLKRFCEKRNLRFLIAGQLSGTVLPAPVAADLAEDVGSIDDVVEYPIEEIYLSTYGINHALTRGIQIVRPLVFIDWDPERYHIKSHDTVKAAIRMGAVGVCKLPDSPVERDLLL